MVASNKGGKPDLNYKVVKEKAAEMLANPDIRTKKEISDELEIAESTLYSWLRDEDFIEKVNSKIDKYTDAKTAEVWQALIDRAVDGDIPAIKLFFEMKEKYVDRKEFRGTVENTGAFDLSRLSDEQLDRMEEMLEQAGDPEKALEGQGLRQIK